MVAGEAQADIYRADRANHPALRWIIYTEWSYRDHSGFRGRSGSVNRIFGGIKMWFFLALASAVFAALTSILAKVGIEGVPSNLATAIRTLVAVVMAWGNGLHYTPAGRHPDDQPEELDFPDPFRLCNRRLMAVLLHGFAGGGCIKLSL